MNHEVRCAIDEIESVAIELRQIVERRLKTNRYRQARSAALEDMFAAERQVDQLFYAHRVLDLANKGEGPLAKEGNAKTPAVAGADAKFKIPATIDS